MGSGGSIAVPFEAYLLLSNASFFRHRVGQLIPDVAKRKREKMFSSFATRWRIKGNYDPGCDDTPELLLPPPPSGKEGEGGEEGGSRGGCGRGIEW